MGKNLIFFSLLVLIVFSSQFILSGKHFAYGFSTDDWIVLAWYKQMINDPFLDIFKAWNEFGPHNFIHAYYIAFLFELFKYNYPYYHIVNTILKSFAVLSFFPVVYILFRNRLLAFLATLIFAFHVSPFGVIFHVLGGEGSLVVLSLNLFLLLYIYAAQKRILSNIKIVFLLFILFWITVTTEITRTYPLILLLTLLEIANYLVNKSSTSIKASSLRLLFFYSPLITLIFYSSHHYDPNLKILKYILDWGNYQLFLSIFSSFGSTFVPEGLIERLSLFAKTGQEPLYQNLGIFLNFLLFKFLIIIIPILIILKFLLDIEFRWILQTLFFTVSFSIIAFWLANHWLFLDPKFQAPVEPSTYFIQGLIGLFVFSTTLSFLISWLKNKRRNIFLVILALAPIFSFVYIFLTWIFVDANAIFMGVHAYLNIPALGASLYLAVILYLAFYKLRSKVGIATQLSATLTIIYFLLFFMFSTQQIDKFFDYWLKVGLAASDQKHLQNSFWNEIGRDKLNNKDPILIYHDSSQDKDNDYFYANAFVPAITAWLTVEKGYLFDLNNCRSEISYKDADELRNEIVDGKKLIVQNTCGYDIFYKPENFYAFKMINRDLIPIKSEILQQLESKTR